MIEPWQWALAILGAFLVGLGKAGVAGLGVLTVAIYATIFPARASVGILLVVLIVGDLTAVALYRREAHWHHLLRLFPWAGGGVLLGALVFGRMSDDVVRLLIGVILVALVVWQGARSLGTPTRDAVEPRRWIVIGTGLLAGFTTMIANAAGPLMVIYLLAMRLPKMAFVGTAAWFFLVLNLFKVPFSVHLGLITPQALGLSVRLAPFALLGAICGRWLITGINQRAFEGIALFFTLAAGLRLLFT